MPIPELTISDRVVICMRHRGDTAGDLAEAMRIHRASIARRLSGDVRWQYVEIEYLADRFDVPVEWLLGDQ